jgi:hypothetical protein
MDAEKRRLGCCGVPFWPLGVLSYCAFSLYRLKEQWCTSGEGCVLREQVNPGLGVLQAQRAVDPPVATFGSKGGLDLC